MLSVLRRMETVAIWGSGLKGRGLGGVGGEVGEEGQGKGIGGGGRGQTGYGMLTGVGKLWEGAWVGGRGWWVEA